MGANRRRVLLVSQEAWSEVQLSKHHYAKALVELGSTVYFLGPGTKDERMRTERISTELHLVTAPGPLRGMRFLPRMLRAAIDELQLKHIAHLCGGGFDILWNFDPYRFRSLRSRTYAGRRIVHIMDLPRPSILTEPALQADLVVAVSPSMLAAVPAAKALHVGHASVQPSQPLSDWAPRPDGVHIGYLGNLGIRYLDVEGLLRIALENPAVTLHLFGPYSGAFGSPRALDETMLQRFRATPNIVLHGPIRSQDILNTLERMDVLLVAYDSARFRKETVNSHKLLEYLHTGRVVVSSWMDDQAHLKDLLIMAQPGQSVSEIIGPVLADLSRWNDPERTKARRIHAAAFSYPKQAERILNALDEHPLG